MRRFSSKSDDSDDERERIGVVELSSGDDMQSTPREKERENILL